MRIGIDLDNTLIDYTEAFLYGAHQFELIPENWSGQKIELKSLIRSDSKGEKRMAKITRKDLWSLDP